MAHAWERRNVGVDCRRGLTPIGGSMAEAEGSPDEDKSHLIAHFQVSFTSYQINR